MKLFGVFVPLGTAAGGEVVGMLDIPPSPFALWYINLPSISDDAKDWAQMTVWGFAVLASVITIYRGKKKDKGDEGKKKTRRSRRSK